MIYGIIKADGGFEVKDFTAGRTVFGIGSRSFPSYEDAVRSCCGKYCPLSFQRHLLKAGELRRNATLDKAPDADVWENLVYADDYRGMWDGTRQEYRNVTSMDKGAATEDEIDYIDALASTYECLAAMAGCLA